ncbi:MAG: HEAT repeat domain-containing protein [Myxococcota bacterium]
MSTHVEKIAKIVDQLDHPDADRQREQMDTLISLGPEALEPLAANIAFATPRARKALVHVLGALGTTKAILPLMRFVFDRRDNLEDQDARGLAMRGIMELAEPKHAQRMFDFLMDVKGDRDPFVRGYALELMGRFGDRRAEPILEHAAQEDDEDFVRQRARQGLQVLHQEGDGAQDALKSELSDVELLQRIRGARAGARTFWVNALLERDNAFELAVALVREGGSGSVLGLQLLQQLGDSRARAHVVRHYISSEETAEHAIALRILAQHIDHDATEEELEVIREGAHDADLFVRMAAMDAGGAAGDERTLRRALTAAASNDPVEALAGAQALDKGVTPEHQGLGPGLREALEAAHKRRMGRTNDDTINTQAHLLGALASLSRGATVGAGEAQRLALKSLEEAEDLWPIVVTSLRVLRDATPEEGLSPGRRWSTAEVRDVLGLLSHDDARVRQRSADVLRRGAPSGLVSMVPSLERLIYDEEVSTADLVIPLLAHAGGRRATEIFEDLGEAEDPTIREAAAAALRSVRSGQERTDEPIDVSFTLDADE